METTENEGTRNVSGGEFECLADAPVVAYIAPGRLALRRKAAMWVARAIAVARRKELRRRSKEQRHGNH
ncbi:MAG: hypothetical protein HY322_21385 [Betaproteobacteria bacterium]|nr:hypothetical protein [Betaproteobacteria bacterium]